MIRPVDMQLSVWRAEQNITQQARVPSAAAAQATQQGEIVQEAQIRDQRVQEGQESGTETRITDRREEPPDQRRRRKNASGEASSEEPEEEEEDVGRASRRGLDFYA